MLPTVNTNSDIFSLVALIVILLFLSYLIYYLYQVKSLENVETIYGVGTNTIIIFAIIILIIILFISLVIASRIFISPKKRREYLDNIWYTSKYVLDGENKKSIKEPTLLGRLLDYPSDNIKVSDKEGNIINVKRVHNDIYQGDDGNVYNCTSSGCNLKKREKINYIDDGINIYSDGNI